MLAFQSFVYIYVSSPSCSPREVRKCKLQISRPIHADRNSAKI